MCFPSALPIWKPSATTSRGRRSITRSAPIKMSTACCSKSTAKHGTNATDGMFAMRQRGFARRRCSLRGRLHPRSLRLKCLVRANDIQRLRAVGRCYRSKPNGERRAPGDAGDWLADGKKAAISPIGPRGREFLLLGECVRRTGLRMVAVVGMPVFEVLDPMRVAPAIIPAIVSKQGIVTETAHSIHSIPEIEAQSIVLRAEIIAEVVLAIRQPREKIKAENSRIDHHRRRVDESRPLVDGRTDRQRRERQPAVIEVIIPISVDEHIAAGRP